MTFAALAALALVRPAAAMSPAMSNVVDAAAMTAALADYTNNVLRIAAVDASEWSVANPRQPLDRLPANMTFQLAVGPDAEDRRMAEEAVALATTSMPAHVRNYFAAFRSVAPALQWIFRRARPGVTNEAAYLSARANGPVWRAKDFDLDAVACISRNMASNNIPILSTVRLLFEDWPDAPIKRALPLVDYPDPRPEVTYETPFGAAVVLRAPEAMRKFRFMATSWPIRDGRISFSWVPLSPGVRIQGFQGRSDYSPSRGCAEIVLDRRQMRGRADVAVFARYDEGPHGPPTILSFYLVPNERRTYDRQGRITRIEYQQAKAVIPQLYQNKPWRDDYVLDTAGNVTGFTRVRTGGFRQEGFSAFGEYVVETHASGQPKVTSKVRYFTRPDDSDVLDYEITDEETTHPLRRFEPRHRGEFPAPVVRARRRR